MPQLTSPALGFPGAALFRAPPGTLVPVVSSVPDFKHRPSFQFSSFLSLQPVHLAAYFNFVLLSQSFVQLHPQHMAGSLGGHSAHCHLWYSVRLLSGNSYLLHSGLHTPARGREIYSFVWRFCLPTNGIIHISWVVYSLLFIFNTVSRMLPMLALAA